RRCSTSTTDASATSCPGIANSCSGRKAMKHSPASTASSPRNCSSTRWRVPENVMLAQGFSPCASSSPWLLASASNAARSRSPGPRPVLRRGAVGGAGREASGSSNMATFLFVSVHEMFHPYCHRSAGFASVAQVEHETRIVRGKPAELGRRHVVPAEELLDFADQHGGSLWRIAVPDSSRAISYLSRKNPMLCRKNG